MARGRPRGLTQKFPLNSEPVMAGALEGAEQSGEATARWEAAQRLPAVPQPKAELLARQP